MKWSFFIGAALLAVYFLLSAGAPPLAIASGVGLALVVTLVRQPKRKSSSSR